MAITTPHFYQYETVDLLIRIKSEQASAALQDYDEIIVSIAQNNTVVNVQDFSVDVQEATITLHMTQKETGKFKKGKATLQVNIYRNKRRKATGYGTLTVLDNLYKKVMGND